MQNNKRIEKEKKYWDKFIPGYKSCIEKNWRIYPSLLDKIAGDVDAGNVVLDVATGTWFGCIKDS